MNVFMSDTEMHIWVASQDYHGKQGAMIECVCLQGRDEVEKGRIGDMNCVVLMTPIGRVR